MAPCALNRSGRSAGIHTSSDFVLVLVLVAAGFHHEVQVSALPQGIGIPAPLTGERRWLGDAGHGPEGAPYNARDGQSRITR